MAKLYYPLESMRLRNDAGLRHNVLEATYGPVRENGDGTPKNHQGWDLYAAVGTPVYAVSDGLVVWVVEKDTWVQGQDGGEYGLQILLQFNRDEIISSGSDSTREVSWFAFYGHLQTIYVKPWDVIKGGQKIGLSGMTGNAKNTTGDPNKSYPHLHFEVRTTGERLGKGLKGRIDPSALLGGHLLSCSTEELGGIDTAQMVCTSQGKANPIASP